MSSQKPTHTLHKRILILLALMLIACSVSASGTPSQSQVAARVARQWAAGSIAHVADSLGRAATLNIPILRSVASQIIEGRLQDKVVWSFSPPQPVGDNRFTYRVTVTATAPFEVVILGLHRTFTISGSFHLLIDTNRQVVTNWYLDPASFRFDEIKPPG